MPWQAWTSNISNYLTLISVGNPSESANEGTQPNRNQRKRHYIDRKHHSFRQSFSLLSLPIRPQSKLLSSARIVIHYYLNRFDFHRARGDFEICFQRAHGHTHTKKAARVSLTPSRPRWLTLMLRYGNMATTWSKNKSTLSNLLAPHSEHSFILCTHFNSSISTLSFYRAQSEHSWKHRHTKMRRTLKTTFTISI